jgi:hypothetical protein
MIGHDPGDELPHALHAVFDERVMLAIGGAAIGAERILYIAFQQSLLVKATATVLLASDMTFSLVDRLVK